MSHEDASMAFRMRVRKGGGRLGSDRLGRLLVGGRERKWIVTLAKFTVFVAVVVMVRTARGESSEWADAADGGTPPEMGADAGRASNPVPVEPLAAVIPREGDGGPGVEPAAPAGPSAPPAESEPAEIRVTGVRPGSAEDGYRVRKASFGAFGELALTDIPFSVHVTPSALYENRNAHTEQEVLQYNPTVANLMAPLAPGGGGMSRTMVRGGTMGDQGVLRDGLVDRGFTYPWFENVERVEVQNGLSSLLYGFGTVGGTVNYVSKRPRSKPFANLSIGQYGGGIQFATADLGGVVRLPSREPVLVRAIAHKEYGSTFVDGSTERRTLLSAIVSHRFAENAEVSADVAYQDFLAQGLQNYIDVNAAKGISVPSASTVDPRKQYGQAWTFSQSNKILAGVSGRFGISDAIAVRAAYRYGTMWRDYNTTFGAFTDNAGAYSETYVATPRQSERTHSEYVLADIRTATGPVEHHVTAGYTGTTFYYERGNDVKIPLGASQVNDPLVVPSARTWTSGSANASRTYYDSLVLGDRVTWSSLSFLVGANYAQIRAKSWALSTICTTSGQCPASGVTDTSQGAFTPGVGIAWHLFDPVTLYGSYIEGLAQGGTAPANAANAYELLPPSHSQQLEIGAKGDLGKVQWSVALFRIQQINEYLDPSDNVYKQDGRLVNQGVEVAATGSVVTGLAVVGGFTVMRPETKRARNNPAIEGKVPVNVPLATGRLLLEYSLPLVSGLSLSVGGNYNGKRFVDNLNTDAIDPSVTFDAGARYEWRGGGYLIGLSVLATNLLDERYWTYYRSGSGLLAGAPRTVSFSAKVGF